MSEYLYVRVHYLHCKELNIIIMTCPVFYPGFSAIFVNNKNDHMDGKKEITNEDLPAGVNIRKCLVHEPADDPKIWPYSDLV